MTLPHDHIDPEGLQEFSVVFTDRSLNHMSARFQGVMRDVSGILKEAYKGSAVALAIGIAAALWGGMGVVQAAQDILANVWMVPRRRRLLFWRCI